MAHNITQTLTLSHGYCASGFENVLKEFSSIQGQQYELF